MQHLPVNFLGSVYITIRQLWPCYLLLHIY